MAASFVPSLPTPPYTIPTDAQYVRLNEELTTRSQSEEFKAKYACQRDILQEFINKHWIGTREAAQVLLRMRTDSPAQSIESAPPTPANSVSPKLKQTGQKRKRSDTPGEGTSARASSKHRKKAAAGTREPANPREAFGKVVNKYFKSDTNLIMLEQMIANAGVKFEYHEERPTKAENWSDEEWKLAQLQLLLGVPLMHAFDDANSTPTNKRNYNKSCFQILAAGKDANAVGDVGEAISNAGMLDEGNNAYAKLWKNPHRSNLMQGVRAFEYRETNGQGFWTDAPFGRVVPSTN